MEKKDPRIGQRFGKLVILERDLSKPSGHGKGSYWICQCDCGNKKSIAYSQLSRGRTKSCGCLRSNLVIEKNTLNLENKQFGRLTAIENTKKLSSHHSYIWKCKCSCGNIHYVSAEQLQSGKVNSCGCLNSLAESKISQILLENGISFTSQISFPDLLSCKNAKLKYDFAILGEDNSVIRLIEFDGEHHFLDKVKQDNGWNNLENYYIIHQNDLIKNQYAIQHKIPLIRIPYWERNNITLDLLMNDKYLVC